VLRHAPFLVVIADVQRRCGFCPRTANGLGHR
jgi:hypothetical protein